MLSRLVLILGAALTLSVASAQLSIKVKPSARFDLTTRYLETIYHEKPDAFYPFLRQLQRFQIRPKITFSDPAFRSSKSLDGKPRPSKYADHNPVFTRLALPSESYQALEQSFARSRLWRDRGATLIRSIALANDVALPTLEKMNEVANKREREIGSREKTCQSWIEVADEKVCNGQEFWKLVGNIQIFARGTVSITGSTPELYSFDRLLPATRNETLPLVILYATPTDEAFPSLFDFLHRLAKPAAGQPRLQFALRWRADPKASSTTSSLGRFDVKAELIEADSESGNLKDVSRRAAAFIEQADNKLGALSRIASSLPLLLSQLDAIDLTKISSASGSADDVNKNTVSLNNVQISNERGIDVSVLLDALKTDSALLHSLSNIHHSDEHLARTILLNSRVAFEEESKPLDYVDLVEATKAVSPLVTRGSFIEGATDEDSDVDPPALATFYLVADLDSGHGRKQVAQVLKFLESATQVRLAFLHRPSSSSSSSSETLYTLSSLVHSLVASRQIVEVYPSELLEFLSLEFGPQGPQRSLDESWTKENPITPFLEGGGLAQEGAKEYFDEVEKFVNKMGIDNGERSAIVLNGRVIRLDETVMSSAALHDLLRHELKYRIRPVAEVALPALPPKLAEDRVLQAELISLATSVLSSSSGIQNRKPLFSTTPNPSISISNSSVVPMFSFVANLDPTSKFARTVVPILSKLAKEDLVTLDVHLNPTSSKRGGVQREQEEEEEEEEEEERILRGSRFETKLEFEEEENEGFDENEKSVEIEGLREGQVVEVSVEVEGKQVGETRKVTIEAGGKTKQIVVFEDSSREVTREGSRHARDEL